MPETGDVVRRVMEIEFEWKIKNFSLNEKWYESPHLKFGGKSWWLRLYPNDNGGYIDLRLVRFSIGSPIKLEFSVSLKITEGRKRFERRQRYCFAAYDYYRINEWIHTSEITNRQTEFLPSGCFTIVLTMKRAESGESKSQCSGTSQPPANQPKVKIAEDFKKILLNQENCDVVLRVQDKEFKAHKIILIARSPVFASMFRSNMRQTVTGTVDIQDIDPSCFSEFLCFLYCGELDKLSAENVCSLFTAANKFSITDLRTMCVEFMRKNLSVDVFCETFALSLLHSELDLINTCEDFFVKNAGQITETDKWESFADENPKQSNNLFRKYVKLTQKDRCS